MKTVALISLGCSRNLVDAEVMLGALARAGFSVLRKPAVTAADICIINTCAFIAPAKEEAVETILRAGRLKKAGQIRLLVVAGCLPQRYGRSLAAQFPEVDLFVGIDDIPRIVSRLSAARRVRSAISGRAPRYLYDDRSPRLPLTPAHYAYIKIAEGCSNRCSYCVIPRIRGAFRSRTVDSVLAEAARLDRGGRLRELVLIGQDTTLFGRRRPSGGDLADLLGRLAHAPLSAGWIRLLYTHPAHYSDALIGAIASEEKVCKYLDIPVQHASDRVLRRMNRPAKARDTARLIDTIRRRVPGIALRTSVIVGFPGETDADFNELLRFIRRTGFERLGAFRYSREEGTPAARLPRQVPAPAAEARLDAVMRLQQGISRRFNESLIGKTLRVLIDEKEGGVFTGRTAMDAPEIDGAVTATGAGLKVGEFCDVRITGAAEYDLFGEKIS